MGTFGDKRARECGPGRGPPAGAFPPAEALESRLLLSATLHTRPPAPPPAVPPLSSRPDAPAALYLDFLGDPRDHATPAYDTDGNAATFTRGEIANVRRIWARVAEKFSPFNLDVTTIDPGNLTPGRTLRVLIGGDGFWSADTSGGLGYVGGFVSGLNTEWVFSRNLASGDPRTVAEAACHEAGHALGLQHQSAYDPAGNRIAEYNPGDRLRAPVMGNDYNAARGVWWAGATSLSPHSVQDDAAVIAGPANGFGYAPDDHGDSPARADALPSRGFTARASGVIEKTSDADCFAFATAGGPVRFTAGVARLGATLDLKLELRDRAGVPLASADTAGLGESLGVSLPAGTYYVVIASHGSTGDTGRYTLRGDFVPAGGPAAPADLSAGPPGGPGRVPLTWADRSDDETGFVIQRSGDGGATWADAASVGANVTSYQDRSLPPARTSLYRVYAYAGGGAGLRVSAYSNVLTATSAPAAPALVSAWSATPWRVVVAWGDARAATGYRVERSSGRRGAWEAIGETSAGANSFADDSARPGASYAYRVRATNAAGASEPSAAVAARAQSADGLARAWRFDEGAGASAADASAARDDCSLAGGAAWAAGRSGSALRLDGAGGYAKVRSNLDQVLGGTASLAAWIKTTQAGSNAPALAPGLAGSVGGAGGGILWGWLDATGRLAVSAGGASPARSLRPVNDGFWHHVVLTRSAVTGQTQIYLDGALDAAAPGPTGFRPGSFSSLGRIEHTAAQPPGSGAPPPGAPPPGAPSPGAGYFGGLLDDVRVYSRVLPADEVRALAAATLAPAVGSRPARFAPFGNIPERDAVSPDGSGDEDARGLFG